MRRCIERIKSKTPAHSEDLYHDLDLQDILVVNLTRAVQICVDIGAHLLAHQSSPQPSTMGETFDLLAESKLI